MDHKIKFGKTVSEARRARKLTQEELARLVGITPVYLRDIEHGKYTATWIIWLKICTVLELDPSRIAEYVKPELNEMGEIMGIKVCNCSRRGFGGCFSKVRCCFAI